MKIYIVEDSKLIRERLVQMIEQIEGATIVGVADNESSAKDEIKKLKPDIVVIDIRLKEGNGLEVLHEIKKELPSTRVIILTNYPYLQYREASLEAGADYFFYKAVEFTKVSDVIKGLMTT